MLDRLPGWLRRALTTTLSLLVVATVHRCVRDPIADTLGRPVTMQIPDKGPHLRIVTWNVRNFPDESEEAHLAERLAALDADLVALQELRDPIGAARLLPDHELHTSTEGGRGGQHVGFAFDPLVLELVAGPFEHPSMTMGGRVRPALSGRLRHRATGLQLDVVVVHLKATPRGHALRQEQWARLIEITEAVDDTPLFVLGDFNTTGPPPGATPIELAALELRLAQSALRRVALSRPCTAYWEGARHDAWKESSILDLVWVRGPSSWKDLRAHPWGPCARHACRAFRSPEAYPDLDLLRGSDHCPVSVDVFLQ